MDNTYLFVLGVKVSGYVQYTGVKLLEGTSVDNAFNREYLEDCPKGDWVVMEVYLLNPHITYIQTGIGEFEDVKVSLGRRLV